MSDSTLFRILAGGLLPVVRAPSSELAIRAVDALLAGGLNVIELTMTVPRALQVIEGLTNRFGNDVLVGAGTVLDAETARACLLAGAAFVVSPIVNAPTIACCRRYGAPVICGALTPTEIVRAAEAGADLVKVFPCDALGGPKYIRALRAPLPDVRLVPTGGVSMHNVADFVKAGACALGVGADLVDIELVSKGESNVLSERARAYVDAVRSARAAMSSDPSKPAGPATSRSS